MSIKHKLLHEHWPNLTAGQKTKVAHLAKELGGGSVSTRDVSLCIKRAVNKKPKKPRRISGYALFTKDYYPKVKAKNPSWGLGQIGKVLGKMWHESPAVKEDYLKRNEFASPKKKPLSVKKPSKKPSKKWPDLSIRTMKAQITQNGGTYPKNATKAELTKIMKRME